MVASVCDGRSLTDLTDGCVREFWGAVLPGAFVVFLTILTIPFPRLPGPLQKPVDVVKGLLTNFLTLPEAEALDAEGKLADDLHNESTEHDQPPVPLWRSLSLSGLALAETLSWLTVGSYILIAEPLDVWRNVEPFVVAFAWFYAASRPITKPTATPPFDLFVLFLLQLIVAVVVSGGLVYDNRVLDIPYPPLWILASRENPVATVV